LRPDERRHAHCAGRERRDLRLRIWQKPLCANYLS
jgi:hypothetical protein